jgi:hypothetical protein
MSEDPVREKRAKILRFSVLAKRTGYIFLLISIVLVGIGAVNRFTPGIATSATIFFFVALALLMPAIILGYAVAKAEREDPLTAR